MRWLILDSLYCRAQAFCSHLDSYAYYLAEAGERVSAVDLVEMQRVGGNLAPDLETGPDILFALDRYDYCAAQPARFHVAQVAALCSPMPWELWKAGGVPAYDLVLSSIPAMVERARAAGCRAEYMPLAFDMRARACGMGVERDLGCIFVGTVGPNHQRRARFLEELRDVVQVLPPVFGRDYFRTLARAKVVFNIHAEWAEGAANNMRMYEAIGMGAALVSDGEHEAEGWDCDFDTAAEARLLIRDLLDDPDGARLTAEWQQESVLLRDCYEHRIPRLLELVRSL